MSQGNVSSLGQASHEAVVGWTVYKATVIAFGCGWDSEVAFTLRQADEVLSRTDQESKLFL